MDMDFPMMEVQKKNFILVTNKREYLQLGFFYILNIFI